MSNLGYWPVPGVPASSEGDWWIGDFPEGEPEEEDEEEEEE
jgi:hypothetical protein